MLLIIVSFNRFPVNLITLKFDVKTSEMPKTRWNMLEMKSRHAFSFRTSKNRGEIDKKVNFKLESEKCKNNVTFCIDIMSNIYCKSSHVFKTVINKYLTFPPYMAYCSLLMNIYTFKLSQCLACVLLQRLEQRFVFC